MGLVVRFSVLNWLRAVGEREIVVTRKREKWTVMEGYKGERMGCCKGLECGVGRGHQDS